jgi:hypothetical protein
LPGPGDGMRVYETKVFARFQRREKVADPTLVAAIASAEEGMIDADLGGGLIKQRIARRGQGKSGGFRTVIAYRKRDMAVFLLGFSKSERGNIDTDELEELRAQSRVILALTQD